MPKRHPTTPPIPERTQQQFKDIQDAVAASLSQLERSYPDTAQSEEILTAHQKRVAQIVTRYRTRISFSRPPEPERPYPVKPLTRADLLVLIGFGIGFPGTLILFMVLLRLVVGE